jgi:hypothetical protein
VKWLLLLALAGCGAPGAGIALRTDGLSGITAVDLYLLDTSVGPKTCAELGMALVALREDIAIDQYTRLDGGGLSASFAGLGDKPRLVVAEAYGGRARIGFGCAAAPMIERDKAAQVTISIGALP